MIEVEQKFRLNPGDRERLMEGAEFVSEKALHDVYFDDNSLSLTTKDCWLRQRHGRWELKVPLSGGGKQRISTYRELETDEEIRACIGLAGVKPLGDELAERGFVPFATIDSKRTKYKHGNFIIDFDVWDFDYNVAEIELMVADETGIPTARKRIQDFATERGLVSNGVVFGKIIESIRRLRPEHFDRLVRAGVINT